MSTAKDFAAISTIYPAAHFASDTGTLWGTVTYPFSKDGIIGVNIVARNIDNPFDDGFPTPQVDLPGPTEYFSGSRENDNAATDDACDFEEITVAAGETREGVDIQINGFRKAPKLVINPAPNGDNVTEDGRTTAGTVVNWYGEALSWLHHEGMAATRCCRWAESR